MNVSPSYDAQSAPASNVPKSGGKKGGRVPGNPNFKPEAIALMLKCVATVMPLAGMGWERVAELYAKERQKGGNFDKVRDADVDSLKRVC